MKVIVFGGTGWLGHNIALQLEKAGMDVTICSRGQKSLFLAEVKHVKTKIADKKNDTDMKAVLSEGYEAVIDTVPTLESIALVRKYAVGLKHYIHCSSVGGYAPLPFIPCDETAPYTGFNSAGWLQKAAVDTEVMELFSKEGFPATVLRPSYITGPGMLPLDNQGGRRQDYIADILAEKSLDVPDNGLALLHPVHVRDLAGAFVLALQQPESVGEIYNICQNHAVTLQKYHELNAAALGKKAHLNFVPLNDMLKKYEGRINETGLRFLSTHMCYSIDKAVRDLSYKPHCTTEEAIEETARWAASL